MPKILKGRLEKIAFEVGDRWFRFAINPESYVHRKPHRTTALKTKSRIVIEDFQSDIPTIVIRGTTGYNPTGASKDRGIVKIREMKSFLEDYADMGGNGATPSETFYFHNFTNKESFVVHLSPEGVNFTQDVNSPLTYTYEISLTVLRYAGEPSEDDKVDPEIGNPDNTLPEPPKESPNTPSWFPILPNFPDNPGNQQQDEEDEYDDIYSDGTHEHDDRDNRGNKEPINPPSPVEEVLRTRRHWARVLHRVLRKGDEIMSKQHSDLIRFVSGINIMSDGSIAMDNLDIVPRFESEMYDPQYVVSVLAYITSTGIRNGEFEEVNTPIRPGTITGMALDSDLSTYAPDIYLLVRLVVLESFALVYSINEDRDNLQYASAKDIQRIKNNVNYLADYMSSESKYLKMVEPLRDVYLSLGYIEHQIDVIMNTWRGR